MDILYIIMKVSDMLRERARAAIGAERRAPRYRPQVSAPSIGGPWACPTAARRRGGAPENQRPLAASPPCSAPPPARKRRGSGQRWSVRVASGGGRIINNKINTRNLHRQ